MSRTLVIHHHHYPVQPPPPAPVIVRHVRKDNGPGIGTVLGVCALAFFISAAFSD